MRHEGYAYGSWGLVITMVVVSLFFIARFVPPSDWLSRPAKPDLVQEKDRQRS